LQQALHAEKFGARIRRKRRDRGVSQRELATLIGVDSTYLCKLENDPVGQSPGEDLVKKLAIELGDDAEELLALAGKVPVDALRTRARGDAPFARFLRRLSEVPEEQISRWTDEVAESTDPKPQPLVEDRRQLLREIFGPESGKLDQLFGPLIDRGAIHDAHIVARLERPRTSRGAGSAIQLITCDFTTNFEARQDEYLVGVVTKRSHLHELREIGAPLDDIIVLEYDADLGQPSINDIFERYDVRYCDEGEGAYTKAHLERMPDASRIWRGTAPDRFPLVVLRASFPALHPSRKRRIELSSTFPVPDENGFWFWTASRPTYVTTITVHAEDLVRDGGRYCRLMTSLPNVIEENETDEGVYSVRVDSLVLTGHGVWLTWSRHGAPALTG
jgi:transcriptional regulator with XRE-family HTH domain